MTILVHPGCGGTKWYHHDVARHKNGIFKEKYGDVQVRFDVIV